VKVLGTLTPWVTALVALAGVVVGALINGRITRQNTHLQIEGQRAVARDNALREQRKQEVQPLLEFAKFCYASLDRIAAAARAPSEAEASAPNQELEEPGRGWDMALLDVFDLRVIAAAQRFHQAWGDHGLALIKARDGTAVSREAVGETGEAFRVAWRQLRAAINAYVFDLADLDQRDALPAPAPPFAGAGDGGEQRARAAGT
jgi:hypothetical protein